MKTSDLKYHLPSIAWALFILVMSLLPGKDIPDLTIFRFDKLVHFGVYAFLGFLAYYGWVKQVQFPGLKKRTLIKIVGVITVYGFIIEVLQETCTADRHFDILDTAMDTSGAILGCYVCLLLKRRLTS